MNLGEGKRYLLFSIVFSWEFCSAFNYECDLVHLLTSACDLVIFMTVVPDTWKYTLITTSKVWVFSDLSFNVSVIKAQKFIEYI